MGWKPMLLAATAWSSQLGEEGNRNLAELQERKKISWSLEVSLLIAMTTWNAWFFFFLRSRPDLLYSPTLALCLGWTCNTIRYRRHLGSTTKWAPWSGWQLGVQRYGHKVWKTISARILLLMQYMSVMDIGY